MTKKKKSAPKKASAYSSQETLRRDAQRKAREAVKSAAAHKKERDWVRGLLTGEIYLRQSTEAQLAKARREFSAYKERCLDTPEVWGILMQMLYRMGLDTGVITTSKFWVNGVLVIRPEQVDAMDSDLRRELRTFMASNKRDKPISTPLLVNKMSHMLARLSPERANFIADELDRLSKGANSSAKDLRSYAVEAAAALKGE